MLPKKVTNSAGIAIVAAVVSAVAHATAMIGSVHRAIDLWPAWVEIFAIAAFVVALGAGIFSYTNAPAKPPGWQPAQWWTFGRLAPATAYVGILIVGVATYKAASPEISKLAWKVVAGTAIQFAFALSVWEKWWLWRQFTPSNATR